MLLKEIRTFSSSQVKFPEISSSLALFFSPVSCFYFHVLLPFICVFGLSIFEAMGWLAKLVNTEQNINQFRKHYSIPEDVQIRYASRWFGTPQVLRSCTPISSNSRGWGQNTFLIQFLTHFRLSPLQCVPNVFRIVIGTAVLMEKLGLELTVHDITYVYRLQKTGRDQYTLVAHVITPFLPTWFSQVSARKTRQPETSRPDLTRARHIK